MKYIWFQGEKSYLLLPMDSMASHGGPMKTIPASAHFRANEEFSLNYDEVNVNELFQQSQYYLQIRILDEYCRTLVAEQLE